jgi:hypothetical protein
MPEVLSTIWVDSEGNSAGVVLTGDLYPDPAICVSGSWEDDYSEESMP